MFASMMGHSFTPDYKQRDSAIAAYERHNADVRATAPREKLVDWTLGDGWEPLCRALDLPVPAEPFPHLNTTAEFIARPHGARSRADSRAMGSPRAFCAPRRRTARRRGAPPGRGSSRRNG